MPGPTRTTSTNQADASQNRYPATETEAFLSLENAILFKKALDELTENALVDNPYGACVYSMPACHGIAKALLMLYPKGRNETTKPPTTAKIEAARRFLRAKVKRHTQTNALSSPLPTVEDLLQPGLFSVDDHLPSRLRIRGKEVVTPCLLGQVIFVAISRSSATAREQQAGKDPETITAVLTQDNDGNFKQRIRTLEIPNLVSFLMTHCIIPGGAWSIYGTISNAYMKSSYQCDNNFERLQLQLLELEKGSTAKSGVVIPSKEYTTSVHLEKL